MDTAAGRSPLSSMLTSVLDLLFLMVICLLTLGGMLSALHRLDPQPSAASGPLASDPQRTLEELRQRYEELTGHLQAAAQAAAREKQREDGLEQELEAASQEQMRLELLLATLEEQLEQLEQQVATVRANEDAWRELEELLGDRGRRLRELDEEQRRLVQRLDDLQGRLGAMKGELDERYKRGGVSRVRPAGKLTPYEVLLTGGAIFPFEEGFIEVELLSPTHTRVRPSGRGLTLVEATRASSPLMRKIRTPSFKRTGWVSLFVHTDSFGTLRALRERLQAAGVRVGWDPVTEPEVLFGPPGPDIIERGPHD